MFLVRNGLGVLKSPPSPIATALQNASNQFGVPLNILQAVAQQESAYNPSAVSPAGAQGLMQIMPANNSSLGITNPFDPQQSANAGAQYLAQLYSQYGDWQTALIAYNEGPGNLASKGPFSSSQAYAAAILANAGIGSDGSGAGNSIDSSTGLETPNSGSFDFSSLFAPGDASGGNGISLVDSTGSLTGWGWAGIGIVAVLGLWAATS